MILKSGKKVSGKKYSENALKAIQKSVDNAKAKLGLPKSEVTPNGLKGYKSATAFKKGDKVKIKNITFEGNQELSDKKLRKALKSTNAAQYQWYRKSAYLCSKIC